jgi:hypothetical protein
MLSPSNNVSLTIPAKAGVTLKTIPTTNLFIMFGRVCDFEDEMVMVEADSKEIAESLFTKKLKQHYGYSQGDEIYIEQVSSLELAYKERLMQENDNA